MDYLDVSCFASEYLGLTPISAIDFLFNYVVVNVHTL